jgi:hypothetical protein
MDMAKTIRCNLYLPSESVAVADRMAIEVGLSRKAVMVRALGILQAMHDGAKDGYLTGQTRDRSKLDTVLVAPLV